MTKPASAKGSVVRSTLNFLRADVGEGALGHIMATLPDDTRALIERAESTEEVPYPIVRSLWSAADEVIGKADRSWMDRAGVYAIRSTGVELYSGILKKSEPIQFLTQSVSLFRLYYRPGDMECVFEAPGTAVLRLVGFDPVTALFCQRQSGGLRCALTLAGGADPMVRHVRCALEGDAFCEWELSWKLAPVTPSTPVLATTRPREP
jgi:hypothetical protein